MAFAVKTKTNDSWESFSFSLNGDSQKGSVKGAAWLLLSKQIWCERSMKIFLRQQMILVLVQQISRKFLTSKLTHKRKKIIGSMMCLFFWGNQYLLKQLKDSENKSRETIHVSTYYQEAENCERIDVMDVTEKLGHTESVPQFSSSILKFVPWVEIIIAMQSFQFGFLTMKLCLKT